MPVLENQAAKQDSSKLLAACGIMCYIVKTFFTTCGHTQHQNVFRCPAAQVSLDPNDLTLTQTKRLPERLRNHRLADGLTFCSQRKPVRPRDGLCEACRRRQVKIVAYGEDRSVFESTLQGQLPTPQLESRPLSTEDARIELVSNKAGLGADKMRPSTAHRAPPRRTSKVLEKSPASMPKKRECIIW
jgi:hypothetical protein